MEKRKKLLTGMQASGRLHIGNYFGALKPTYDLLKEYDSTLFLADLHALTTVRDPEKLRSDSFEAVRTYLALGFDPEEILIFRQSDVIQHTELAWMLECMVTVPFLQLAHSYKDKIANNIEPNAGLFNYPMLMAADILLYDTNIVPVGKDQEQHLEYTREAARKFNIAYGDTFIEPKSIISAKVGVVPGTDGRKMSKSYKNTIPLFGTHEEITKACMSIVTDSTGDRPENVYALHMLFKTPEDLEAVYEENKGKYKNLKESLITDIEAYFAPYKERYDAITEADVATILKAGAEKARVHAETKMEVVRKKMGLR